MTHDGLVSIRSASPFPATLAAIEGLLAARGVILFARVDHAAGAKAVGQAMSPTVLLLFGSPAAGTPVMQARRTAGLDLPLKALVWEDDDGTAWVTYDDPRGVLNRHGLEPADFPTAAGMSALFDAIHAAVSAPAPTPEPVPIDRATARDSGPGPLRAQVSAGGQAIIADEPYANNGTEMGPSPHTLLSAGLAACTALTLRTYAVRKGWPLAHATVAVEHDRDPAQTPADVFHRQIALEGPLDAEQTTRLLEIAERCPVHLTLTHGSRVETTLRRA